MFWNRVHNGPSRSSKVVDFGTNRKCVCDFLLVINSNLGPILPRFRDIASFLLVSHLYSTRILGVFPLDYIAGVVAPRSEGPEQIIHVIIFELVQTTCPWYLNVRDRQTDGQIYNSNTVLALRASCGKNTNHVNGMITILATSQLLTQTSTCSNKQSSTSSASNTVTCTSTSRSWRSRRIFSHKCRYLPIHTAHAYQLLALAWNYLVSEACS